MRYRLTDYYHEHGALPVFSGGDGTDEPETPFPAVPEDLAELGDDELAGLIEAYGDAADQVLGEVQAGDVTHLADLEAAAGVAEALRAEQSTRAEQAEQAATQAAELADRIRGPVEDDTDAELAAEETPEVEDEPAAEETPEVEPVAASAAKRPAAPAPATHRRRPRPSQTADRLALCAAGDGMETPVGQPFASMEVFYEQVARRVEQTRGVSGHFQLARIRGEAPEDQMLRAGDREGNRRKIDARLAPAALAASGGLCAPATPYYDLLTYSSAERPLRASLPSFQATRGGIITMPPLTIADISTAVGRITAGQDAAGGSSATKTNQRVTCGESTETDIAAIYQYVEFGELGMRTYPEQVEQFMQLVDAAWARKAEIAILDAIKAASVTVTGVAPTDGTVSVGLVSTIIGEIAAVVAGLRQRHRMPWQQQFRCVIQEWLLLAMMVDEDRRVNSDGAAQTLADVQAKLTKYGVNLVTTKDSATNDLQTMGGPASGVSSHTGEPLPFPGDHVAYIYPEGTFLFLDGGELNVGMIRDSTLVATNDVQFFQETFENTAFVGVESIRLVTPVGVSGVRSGGISVVSNNHLV